MVIARGLLLLAGVAAMNTTAATLLPLRVDAQHVPGFLNPTVAGAIAADFEGIGRDDIAITGMQRPGLNSVMPGEAHSGFVAILHFDMQSQTYALVQTLITDDADIAGIALDPTSNAGPGLVVVSQAGALTRYSGWPLQLVSRVSLNQSVSGMQVGDVDGNGRPDVVVTHPVSGLAAYDLVTGALERAYAGRAGNSLALAQLDADPALEIVLSGTPGYVIDGAANAVDWQYAGGIGDVLAAGMVLADGTQGFTAAQDRYLSTFRGTPYSPIWSLDGRYTAVDFAAIDGSPRLLLGSRDGVLEILDPVTQAVQASLVADPAGHLAAGHLEGTTALQIVSSSGIMSSASDRIQVNGSDGGLRFSLEDEDGPFVVAAHGDVDGDGHADGVWASYYSASLYEGGYLHIYDPITGAERSRARLTNADGDILWLHAFTALALTPAAGRMNIVAAAENFRTPELCLIDGRNQRMIVQNASTPFGQQRPINQLVALDNDVLAAVSDSVIEMARFSGTDLHAIWHRTLSSAYGTTLNDLSLARLAGPLSNDALLATSSALLAYDLDAQSVLWSTTMPTASAAVLKRGDGTPVVGALGMDGHLRLLSLDGANSLSDIAVGTNEAQALAPVPNMPGIALACIDRRVAVVDIDAGSVLQTSPWIGGLACNRGNLAVMSTPAGGLSHIVAGSIVGAFDLTLATDAIFGNGFDGN